jgi:hypothetical protein
MPPSGLAPIAFFAHRRPWKTLQALYSLSRCPEAARSELFIFCDAAKTDADRASVALVREVVRAQRWCGTVEIREAATNRGLARSIIDEVTALTRSHGRVIVLEDDLLVAKGLLDYMNRALDKYRDAPAVMQVSAHSFPAFAPSSGAVLMPLATTWGWGTWERAWARFEEVPRGADQLQLNRPLRQSFDLDGAYPYSRMLEEQLAGHNDSWGIRWWWTVHQHHGLSLFPLQTLVRNIGFDGEGTHTRTQSPLADAPFWSPDSVVLELPTDLEIDSAAFEAWKRYVHEKSQPGLRHRLGQAARTILDTGVVERLRGLGR